MMNPKNSNHSSARNLSACCSETRVLTEAAKLITPSPDRVKWDYKGARAEEYNPVGAVAVDAYMAPNVVLAGQVTAFLWFGAVLCGDLDKISIGFCSNVQESCVLPAAWSSPTC